MGRRSRCLPNLKQSVERKELSAPRPRVLRKVMAVPAAARPYLERMRLDAPRTFKERLLQRAVVYALASIDAI